MLIRIDSYGKNPLPDLYERGDIVEFKKCIKEGWNVNCLTDQGTSLISYVMENENKLKQNINKLFFEELIENNVHLYGIGAEQTLLITASTDTSIKSYYFKRLLDLGLDIEEKANMTDPHNPIYDIRAVHPIFYILANKKIKEIEYFLSKNPNLKVSTPYGDPLLNFLVTTRREEDLKILLPMLIEKGASFDNHDFMGDTALHNLSWQQSSEEIYDILLKYIDVNSVNNTGLTAIIQASESDNVHAMKILIKKNADINHKNNIDDTPIIIAAKNNSYKSFCLLAKSGADLTAQDFNGCNVVNWLVKQVVIQNPFPWQCLKLFANQKHLLHVKDNKNNTAYNLLKSNFPKILHEFEKYISNNRIYQIEK